LLSLFRLDFIEDVRAGRGMLLCTGSSEGDLMTRTIRVAGAQMTPRLADVAANLSRCLELLEIAAEAGAQLVVFPEAALTGYVFRSLEEAIPVAESIPGPSTDVIASACRRLNLHAVVGLLERDGEDHYNASALMGPAGLMGKYRKLHLPYLGIDRFLRPGNLPPRVHETSLGRIGLSICYDLDFPEYPRVLALMGAQIIVTCTNWPEDIEFVPDHVVQTRARENVVNHIAVNRVGEERGVRFIGRSKVVDPWGTTLVEGKHFAEDLIYAEIDPTAADQKRKVVVPGELEVDAFKDRRPEFYGPCSD
jgi:predicted amidohydrolase